MSKGSTGRPFSVSNEEYSNRWNAIFGKDNEKNNKAQEVESDMPNQPCNRGGSDNPEGQARQTETS